MILFATEESVKHDIITRLGESCQKFVFIKNVVIDRSRDIFVKNVVDRRKKNFIKSNIDNSTKTVAKTKTTKTYFASVRSPVQPAESGVVRSSFDRNERTEL